MPEHSAITPPSPQECDAAWLSPRLETWMDEDGIPEVLKQSGWVTRCRACTVCTGMSAL